MARDFTGVDLGVADADDQFGSSAPVPAWQRRGVVAALFAFGLVVGVLGWQARVDNAVDLDLIASSVAVQGRIAPDDPARRHFGLNIYNAGRQDLTLVGIELPGWEPPSGDEHDQTLRSGQWTTVSVAAAPTCDAPLPDEIVATVRRDTTDIAIALEMPPGQEPLSEYGDACAGVEAPLTVRTLQNRQWLNARTDGALVTEIGISGSVADNAVVDVSGEAAGLTGRAATTPVPMLLGGRVDILWEITNCAAAESLTEVEFEVTVESVAGERTQSMVLSEPYLTYVLSNYVVREC